MSELEIRHLQADEIRAKTEDDSTTFEGYVTRFNQIGSVGNFHERVDSRAFDNSLKSDDNIFLLYNHDYDKILGSTRNKSLELFTDDEGLRFKFTPKAQTSYLKDITELVRNNEIRGMSFGFIVNDDEWKREDGKHIRTLLDVELREVTITAIPFYESSEVNCRSYDNYKAEQQRNKDLELLKLQLDLIKLKQQQ